MSDEHSHPVLPWYEYDEVAYVEVLKNGRPIERFEPYQTEEDIKRALREMQYRGTFDVRGLDDNLRPLPHQAQIIVSAGGSGHLTNLLGKTKNVKGISPEYERQAKSDNTSIILEHQRQQQSAEERARREEARRLEQLYERQTADRLQALEERRAEEQRLLERQREIEEERAARVEREAREAAEAARREARERIDSIKAMYEAQLSALQQNTAQESNMLTSMSQAQIAQANAQQEIWRMKCENLEQENKSLIERMNDARDQARSEVDRAKKYAEEAADQRIKMAEERFQLKEDHYTSRIEALQERVEELKEKVQNYELKFVQLNLTSQIENQPSAEFQETMGLLKVAKEHGIDAGKVIEHRLGMGDVKAEKKSAIDTMVEAMLPMMAQKVTGLPAGSQAGTQGAESSQDSAPQGSTDGTKSDVFPGATIQRL